MKKYVIREEISENDRKGLIEHPELLQHLLYHRGIRSQEESQKFLNPDYENHGHDPNLLKDMDKAVSRILEAIKKEERIVIFSDYDADGIPGGVILHDFFKKIGYKNFENYIPHRHDEGFGLNGGAIEGFGKSGAKVMITVDCGTADSKEIDKANSLGIDVIITDHHEPNGSKPKACAVLNPKQDGCGYPDKGLCGSGVAYKLIQGILKKDDFGLKDGWEKWLLDMVGLATLSDMVSLTGENRVFAFYGLKVIRKSPRIGLMKLLRKIGVNQKMLSEDDVVFSLTPKLNAASRMGHPIDAFNLLSTEDETEADRLSSHLMKINDERKGIVGSMVKEMKKIVAKRYPKEKKAIVMGNPDWRPALLGLAASALSRENSCPVFLWGRDGDNIIKGSCRSDGSADVVKMMQSASDAFLEFGGHTMSGGFSVANDKIHQLEQKLLLAYENVRDEDFLAENIVDKKISLDDVNWYNYNIVEKLSPFGIGNTKPVFLIEGALVGDVRQFGKEKNHLELILRKNDGSRISAISFFSADNKFDKIPEVGKKTDLVATLEKSTYRNFPELRLRIIDIL